MSAHETEAALDIRDLSLVVRTDEGTARILENVSLTLAPGSIHGVVGESGCGKSTLLRAILGVLPKRGEITRGSIMLRDRDLLKLPRRQLERDIRGREIGIIPQDPLQALNPVFRVGKQMMEMLRPVADRFDGPAQREQHLLDLLRAVQLPDVEQALQRYPHQFSGGQRQRLLIAKSLAAFPKIILADEPTTALDVTTQLQILKLLKNLARERGLSMLFVTHDFGVVAQLCDTLTVMYAGQSVESGPVERVLTDPVHPYTRMLLACHPDVSEQLAGIPGSVPSPLRPPGGCRFNPRCPQSIPACTLAQPERSMPGPGRAVRCVMFDKEAV